MGCDYSAGGCYNAALPSRVLLTAVQRRPKLLIVAFTVSVLLAVAVVQALSLWWQRERVRRAAETRVSNLALVLSEYVRGALVTADTSLRQLAIHARRIGGPGAPADVWDPILSAARGAIPGGGSLSVTDAAGIIRRSTLPAIVGQSRRDNYVFKQLAAIDRDELVVDRPFVTPLQRGRYIMPLGRRLTDADGRFEGTVVAVLMPESFRDFFRTVDVGAGGSISILHPDGVILFREPSADDPIGQPAAGHPALGAVRDGGRSGTVRAPMQAGGALYLTSYRTAGGTPPLIAAVSLSEDEVFADWRRQVHTSLIAFTALTLTLLLMVRGIFRQMDARARIEQALVDSQRLEAERLRGANERLENLLEREQRARMETEAASYMKDEFLMTFSHELSTPLTAIYGWARMLGGQEMTAEQRARALAAVERNARAQTRLIDDLLDVSRAISGKLRLDARAVSLSEVLLAAVEVVAPALEAKSLRLDTDIDRDLAPVVADPDRVQQIVWNLLSNAIKFTPQGGWVRLTLRRADSHVEIAVSDSGVGIDPAFLPHVFDRFRQAEAGSRRRYGGLGLGLAIVRHLSELHGGSVSAESAGEGRGSTFKVLLPLRVARGDASPGTSQHEHRPGASQPVERLDDVRVLVVDDEVDSRELFASILESAGAEVLTAASAADAHRLLETERVDVLLSDIGMPGEDGYELLQRSRDGGAGRVPALAVTAYARAADRRRALDAGFDEHLAKPVEPADLVGVVASLARSAAHLRRV